MFIGQYSNCLDAKNRMTVPAKYRADLEPSCVISKSLDTCLIIYTMEEWKKVMEKLDRIPNSDKKGRSYRRFITSNAEVVQVDKQGRILIPEPLLKYAEMEKDLVTAGSGPIIEVWARDLWPDPDNDPEFDPQELGEYVGSRYGI